MAEAGVQGRIGPRLVGLFLLVAAVAASYRAGFRVFFVNEDFTWLWRCRASGAIEWLRLLTSDVMEGSYSWRPLVQVAFALQDAGFGWNPTPLRWQAVAWHVLASGALYLWLAARLGPIPAMAGTCLFAIHPLQVESLVWASALGGPMTTALLTLALIVALSSRLWIVSGVLMLLALAAHESALLALLLLPAAWLLMGRCGVQSRVRAAHLGAFAAAAALFFGLRFVASPAHLAPPASAPHWFARSGAGDALLIMAERLARATAAVAGGESLALGLAIWALLLALGLWSWWQREGLALWGLLWFALALLPYTGTWFGLAPRYFHLALVGFGIVVAAAVANLIRGPTTSRAAIALPVAACVLLAWVAIWQPAIARELDRWWLRGERTRQLLVEVKTLVPEVQPGERFAFSGLGELRMHDGVFVFGLDDALRLLYREPTLQVEFVPLGTKADARVHLQYLHGHLWRAGGAP